jgi:anaerobic magnesium-protoporphyrin IX monomethyl ester cyclase
MRVSLISPYEDVSGSSIRTLSSSLRLAGHDTQLIFLSQQWTTGMSGDSFRYPYTDRVLDQVSGIVADSDLVGITLMSNHFDNAVQITSYLQKSGQCRAPIIWGGVHPTVRPEECLMHADLICVGEGELALPELAASLSSGKSSMLPGGIYSHGYVPNTSFAPAPLIQDLDAITDPDYDLKHQFVLYHGVVTPLTPEILAYCLGGMYPISTSRGCVYTCAYCCNDAFSQLYGHKLRIRWRSVESTIHELETAKQLIPNLSAVNFEDDAFLAQPQGRLEEFCQKYKNRIALPFKALSTPSTISDAILTMLIDAGLYYLSIGIQTGSDRIRKLYRRPETDTQIWRAIDIIKKFSGKLETRYDFILDNPWETDEDTEASLHLAARLSSNRSLALFSLTLYPGTHLYNKASSEGIITDDLTQVYRKEVGTRRRCYLNGVFEVADRGVFPPWVIEVLLNHRIPRQYMTWLPYLLAKLARLIWVPRKLVGFARRGLWRFAMMRIRQSLLGQGKYKGCPPMYDGPAGSISRSSVATDG